jgi:hypothetical protein
LIINNNKKKKKFNSYKINILSILYVISLILLFLINIFFLLKKIKVSTLKINLNEKLTRKNINSTEKIKMHFKISDYFFLNIIQKSYREISDYLNNKYKFNNRLIMPIKIIFVLKNYFFPSKRKKIVLYSVDLFSFANHKRWLMNKLKEKFIIEFNQNNPDYLIYNVFGTEHLNPKYNNAVKIAIFTENRIPDFNKADYVIGHYHINYLDRYFKYSIFLWQNLNNTFYNLIRKRVLENPTRIKFCAAVISNGQYTNGFRLNFIKELNKYKRIDMGGYYNNNIGGRVKDKIKFLSSYKFSISMENSEGNGYISEKILNSFSAGTIPIYYGDYMIDEYINPKSYILIKGEKDMFEKIEYIKKIDNDINLYKSLLKENVFLDNNIRNKNDKELKQFLQHIFEQDKSKAYRVDY